MDDMVKEMVFLSRLEASEYQFQKGHIDRVPDDGTRLGGREEIDKVFQTVIPGPGALHDSLEDIIVLEGDDDAIHGKIGEEDDHDERRRDHEL